MFPPIAPRLALLVALLTALAITVEVGLWVTAAPDPVCGAIFIIGLYKL